MAKKLNRDKVRKEENNNHCPGCKAYKELGMTACLGCCGHK